MREMLRPTAGLTRSTSACRATEMMGSQLSQMPALLSGFNSVNNTLRSDVAQAPSNIRLLGCAQHAPRTRPDGGQLPRAPSAPRSAARPRRRPAGSVRTALRHQRDLRSGAAKYLTPDDVAALRCLSQPLVSQASRTDAIAFRVRRCGSGRSARVQRLYCAIGFRAA